MHPPCQNRNKLQSLDKNMIPSPLPLAPPSIANASVLHGARRRGRRLPSHDPIEIIHDRQLGCQERIASDALLSTFCILEATTVQATLRFIKSIMDFSNTLSSSMAQLGSNGADEEDALAELWGSVVGLLGDADKLQTHAATLPKLWSARQEQCPETTHRGLKSFLSGYRATLSGLVSRREALLARFYATLNQTNEPPPPLPPPALPPNSTPPQASTATTGQEAATVALAAREISETGTAAGGDVAATSAAALPAHPTTSTAETDSSKSKEPKQKGSSSSSSNDKHKHKGSKSKSEKGGRSSSKKPPPLVADTDKAVTPAAAAAPPPAPMATPPRNHPRIPPPLG